MLDIRFRVSDYDDHRFLQRTETLKALVKANFDRFVRAKSQVDRVYGQMHASRGGSGSGGSGDFGTESLRLALDGPCLYTIIMMMYMLTDDSR